MISGSRMFHLSLLVLAFQACSDRPTENLNDFIMINIIPPGEALYADISLARITVSAVEFETPYDTIIAVNSLSGETVSALLEIDPGPARLFRVGLQDQAGRFLYQDSMLRDKIPGVFLTIDFRPAQFGFGTATGVKLFRDRTPWDSFAMDSILLNIGLSSGTGPGHFELFSSAEIAGVELSPGTDMVIISNDQPQEFYDILALNQSKFDDFVRAGGVIFWGACDMGWNYGSIADAALELPGNIRVSYLLDQANLVINTNFEFLSNLSDTLHGNYASQEVFFDLPYGAIVYMTDTGGNPTLIGMGIGQGWTFVSGQPLEYNLDRTTAYDIGVLLPRIIRFILGMSAEDALLHFPDGNLESLTAFEPSSSEVVGSEGSSRQ